MAKQKKTLTVADLRELLADFPDDLAISCTSSDCFPITRELVDAKACQTEAPHAEGRLVLFAGTPRAALKTKAAPGKAKTAAG